MKKYFVVLVLAISVSSQAWAKVKVVATTADIQAIAKTIGGEQIELSSLAKGSTDPHYLEAKPSYMVKLRDVDLLIANGLALEVGWLPSLIRGARNPKVNPGSRGHLDLGALVDSIEKPSSAVTRAMGDVHPEGNPHFTLDPIRVGELGLKIAERLGELDPPNKDVYWGRAKTYQNQLN